MSTLRRAEKVARAKRILLAAALLSAAAAPQEGQPGSPPPRRDYGIAIGVGGSAAYARRFYEYLTSPKGAGLTQRNGIVLADRAATLAAIRVYLEEVLTEKARPGDTVYVYIGGQTRQAGFGEGYLVASDSDPEATRTTAYPLRTLRELLEATRGTVILFADLSGSVSESELQGLSGARSLGFGIVALNSNLSPRLLDGLTGKLGQQDEKITAGYLLRALEPLAGAKVARNNLGMELANLNRKAGGGDQPQPLPPPGPPRFAQVLEEAQSLLKAGKPEEAIPKFDEVLSLDAANRAALEGRQQAMRLAAERVQNAQIRRLLLLGQDYLKSRRFAEAVGAFEDASKLDPQLAAARQGLKDALTGLAQTQMSSELWDKAAETLQRALPMAPGDKRLSGLFAYASGMAASKVGNGDLAIKRFQEAVKLGTRPAEDRLLEATVRKSFEEGKAAQASQRFDQALENFQRVRDTLNQVKDQEIRKGLIEILDYVIAQLPLVKGEVAFRLGEKLLDAGSLKEARAQFFALRMTHPKAQEMLDKMPDPASVDRAEVELNRGKQSAAAWNWVAAKRHFELAVNIYPSYEPARILLKTAEARVRVFYAAGGGAGAAILGSIVFLWAPLRRARTWEWIRADRRAARIYEQVLDERPAEISALLPLAELYARRGNRDRIKERCATYRKLRPDEERVLSLEGNLYFEYKEWEAALEKYERILELGKADQTVYERLLAIHGQGNVGPDRTASYEEALRRDPGRVELVRILGGMYARQDRTDPPALDIYRRILAFDPDNVALRLKSAQGWLEQDRVEKCLEDVREILQRTPAQEALDLLLRAGERPDAKEGVLRVLSSSPIPPLMALSVYERMVELHPDCRSALEEPYRRIAERLPREAPERSLYLAHLALDREDYAEGASLLEQAYERSPRPQGYGRELIRAYRRFLQPAEQSKARPDLVFRLGELYRQETDWESAAKAFQQVVVLPEWQQRAASELAGILDALGTADVAAKFFADARWKVQRWEGGDDRAVDLAVDPAGTVTKKLHWSFVGCQVRCFQRSLTAGDIARWKEVLQLQEDVNRQYTFVVAPTRPRPEAFAMIYASITDDPPVRIILLEAGELKQAIIDSKCAETLDQALRLWVGQSDLFDLHNPILDAATFFGRQKFINRITTKILQRENFGIYGLRKVGKTSLVFQLRENLPAILIAYVDLQVVTSHRCEEIYFGLVEALRKEMRRKYPDVPVPRLQLQEYNAAQAYPTAAAAFGGDLARLRQTLEQAGKTPRVLLLLDEIELLIPHGKNEGFLGHQEFFRQVRGLYQTEGFVTSGVVGADPSLCRSGRWGDRDNPVFQYYDEIFLTFLERAECDQMVSGIGGAMGVSFDAASLEQIYAESGGQPFVARQLCSCIASRYTERPLQVTAAMVADGIDDYILRRPDYFLGVFTGYLSERGRKILLELAKNPDNEMSRSQILENVPDGGEGGPSAGEALQDLELFHLLERSGEAYRTRILLLRRWIRRSRLGRK